MIKNTVAYLMFMMLGFFGSLNAQPFNQAQEKAFAEATVQLLEGILYVDDEFNSESIQGVRTNIDNILRAFNEVGGIVDNQLPSNGVRFAPFNYNAPVLLNTVCLRLGMIEQSLRLLESFLVVLEQDRGIGPHATGHRDDWRQENDWEDEYLYDDQTGAVVLDEDGNPVIDYSLSRNVPGRLVEGIREDFRMMLNVMDLVLRNVFEVRRGIIVRGVDETGLYEDEFYYGIGDLAEALFNQVRAGFIPRREENENGVNLRRAVNLTLRDLDNWLGLTEQEQENQPNARDDILTYRFHEGQAEAFAAAMIRFFNWVSRMDSRDSISQTEALLAQLRDVRSRFRNVLNAPSQQEQYEFIFNVVEAVFDDEEDFNPLFVNTHAERARNRARLNGNQDRLTEFDYDGINLLQRIDEELDSAEAFLAEFAQAVREEHLVNRGFDHLFGYYQYHRSIMERRLGRLINGMEPILRNVFEITPDNGVGPQDLRRGFEQWLERLEEDYPLVGGLRVNPNPVRQPLAYRGNVHPRDYFEGNVYTIQEGPQQPVRPQMRADAPLFQPTQDPYQDPVAGGHNQPQQPVVQNPYPQQVHTTQHIQLVPGAQPQQNPHTIVLVQQPNGYNGQPGHGYPQQHVEPCIQQQQINALMNQGFNPQRGTQTLVYPQVSYYGL